MVIHAVCARRQNWNRHRAAPSVPPRAAWTGPTRAIFGTDGKLDAAQIPPSAYGRAAYPRIGGAGAGGHSQTDMLWCGPHAYQQIAKCQHIAVPHAFEGDGDGGISKRTYSAREAAANLRPDDI
jgi:hypothetical protein